MIAYIDSSVLLRIILDEDDSLKEIKNITLGISSILLKIECLRTLDRLRLENCYTDEEFSRIRSLFFSSFKKLSIIPVTEPVIESACQAWGFPLKSLDSIHLASALLWRRSEKKQLLFCTHDRRLALAAQASDLEVLGV
jgi:predicted nucleic acid-binding protein